MKVQWTTLSRRETEPRGRTLGLPRKEFPDNPPKVSYVCVPRHVRAWANLGSLVRVTHVAQVYLLTQSVHT